MPLKLENNIGSKFNLTHANNAGEINLTSKDLASTKLVNSIGELKLISGSTADKLEVLGYYEKGDGGGGLFYWDSASTEVDNGGTIIQATGVTTGRWVKIKNVTNENNSSINPMKMNDGNSYNTKILDRIGTSPNNVMQGIVTGKQIGRAHV